MATVVRLRSQGVKNRVMYRVVVMDKRTQRDGKYIECVGTYNPYGKDTEQKIDIKGDRLMHWISQGAVISDRVESLTKEASPEVMQFLRQKREKQITKKKASRKKK